MDNQLARYHAEIIYPGIGESGQRALLAAHVTVIGVGATGSVLANHCRGPASAICGWWTTISSS